MSRKHIYPTHAWRIVVGAIFALAAAVSATADTAAIAFKFNPPDGTRFLERVKESEIIGGGSGKSMSIAVTLIEGYEVKKTDTGFNVRSGPLAMETTINGRPVKVEGAMSERMASKAAIVTRKIDKDGRIQAVDGFDAYFNELKQHVAAEDPSRMGLLIGLLPALRQGAETQVKEEWSERVADYIGKSMAVGELWKSQEQLPAYSGNVAVNQRTRLVGQEIRDGHPCVRLRFHFEADPKAFKAEMKGMMHDMIESYGLSDAVKSPTFSNVAITGDGERVVDPETLLVYADTMAYSTRFTMSIPGHGKVTFSGSGKRECSFDYSLPNANDHPENKPAGSITGAPIEDPNSTPAIAKQMVNSLSKADYASIVKKFDETMAKSLSEDRLRANWEAITESAGAFQEQSGVKTASQQGFDVVTVTCRFEKSSIDVQFAFNKDKQISGLYFRPAGH